MNMICNNCQWFVEETNIIGDYQHIEAVKQQKGFCIMKDLFTNVKPFDKACTEYIEYKEEK